LKDSNPRTHVQTDTLSYDQINLFLFAGKINIFTIMSANRK
jgi:hypothetical protein